MKIYSFCPFHDHLGISKIILTTVFILHQENRLDAYSNRSSLADADIALTAAVK